MFDPLGDPSRVYYGTDTRAADACWSEWRSRSSGRRGGSSRRSAAVRALVLDGVGVVGLAGAGRGSSSTSTSSSRRCTAAASSCVALLAALVIAVAVHPAGVVLGAFLGLQPLRWIGKRSYGIYLWHWPVYMITRPSSTSRLTGLPLLVLRIGHHGRPRRALVPLRRATDPQRRRSCGPSGGSACRKARSDPRRIRVTVLSGGAAALALVVIVVGLANRVPRPCRPGSRRRRRARSGRARRRRRPPRRRPPGGSRHFPPPGPDRSRPCRSRAAAEADHRNRRLRDGGCEGALDARGCRAWS